MKSSHEAAWLIATCSSDWWLKLQSKSNENQKPYCHGWLGQPGGRGLWDEVWTCARVNQSGVRHWQYISYLHSIKMMKSSVGSQKRTCQQWCGNSRRPCWQTCVHESCRHQVSWSRRPWGKVEKQQRREGDNNARVCFSHIGLILVSA